MHKPEICISLSLVYSCTPEEAAQSSPINLNLRVSAQLGRCGNDCYASVSARHQFVSRR